MSFDKKYDNRKDIRKPYYRSKSFDRTCRPHGGCPYCFRSRTYANKRKKYIAEEKLKEYNNMKKGEGDAG